MRKTPVFLAAAALLLAGAASAQAPTPSDARLGPMANELRARVGVWDVELMMQPSPATKPIRIKAIMINHLVGGRWLVSEMSGAGFQGLGVNGYSPDQAKYVGYWVDGMQAAAVPVEGHFDPATRVFTTRSIETAPSGREVTVMSETRMVSPDREETVFTAPDSTGQPFVRMSFTSTRTSRVAP